MQFVEEVPQVSRERASSKKWDEVATLLQENRGKWGVVEETTKMYRAQMTRTLLGSRGEFEVKYRKGVVYARAL